MAAKRTSAEAGTEQATARRAPSKRAAAQHNKPARNRKPAGGRVTKSVKLTDLTHEMIAERAYHISLSEFCGTDEENWHRAERELRQGA